MANVSLWMFLNYLLNNYYLAVWKQLTNQFPLVLIFSPFIAFVFSHNSALWAYLPFTTNHPRQLHPISKQIQEKICNNRIQCFVFSFNVALGLRLEFFWCFQSRYIYAFNWIGKESIIHDVIHTYVALY